MDGDRQLQALRPGEVVQPLGGPDPFAKRRGLAEI